MFKHKLLWKVIRNVDYVQTLSEKDIDTFRKSSNPNISIQSKLVYLEDKRQKFCAQFVGVGEGGGEGGWG